jgi:hypothetical protein
MIWIKKAASDCLKPRQQVKPRRGLLVYGIGDITGGNDNRFHDDIRKSA